MFETVVKFKSPKSEMVIKEDAENKDGFDVVFLIDSRTGSSTEDYAEIQKNIIETADYVFSKSPNARVRLVELFQIFHYLYPCYHMN